MSNATLTATAPRAQDAADIRATLATLADARAAGDLEGWPEVDTLVRDVTKYLDGEAGRLPARVGSPALRVIAALPAGTDGREVIAVVEQAGQPGRFGHIRGYRNDLADGTVRWSATSGAYDYTDLTKAIRGAVSRAGVTVVWPDPDYLTADQVYVQRLAEMFWRTATSESHGIAWCRSPVYRHTEAAFVAAVREVYGLSELKARRVRDLLGEYGPDDSLRDTGRKRGVASYVEFVQSHTARDHYFER